MHRGGNNYSSGPPPSAGRGQHLLKPAWMTQGLQQNIPSSTGAGASQPPAYQQNYPAQVPHQQQQQGGYSYPQQQPPQQNYQQYNSQPGYNSAQSHGYQQSGGAPPPRVQSHGQSIPYRGGAAGPGTGLVPVPVVSSVWIESKTPEGRVFYSNTATGESTFDKPYELKTSAERQLPTSVWREYCKDGKIYYVNSETKQSSWEEPVEYSVFKRRLKSHCAGEAPTKDQVSLAVYQAAKKAVDELVVDLDGSYAKLMADEAIRAERDAKPAVTSRSLDLKEISGDLPTISPPKTIPEGDPKQVFLDMLEEWKVPLTATWDEAFSFGIGSDPRYGFVKPLAQRKAIVEERRLAALDATKNNMDVEKGSSSARATFEAYLDELEERKALGPRTTFQAVAPLIRFEKKMPPNELDARSWLEARVDNIVKRLKREREAAEQAIESKVHDLIRSHIPNAEELDKAELFNAFVKADIKVEDVSIDRVKKFCASFAQRLDEKREAEKKEVEIKSRDALKEGIMKAFKIGALSVDARWAEFKVDEELRTTRAPFLADLLMPLAGNESAVEKEFRAARDDVKDLIADVAGKMREMGWTFSPAWKRLSEVTDAKVKEDAKTLEDVHGSAIVSRAFEDYVKRLAKDKERYFELLERYIREPKEADWAKIEPLIADRTAYKDLGTAEARKTAFDEFVATLETRRRSGARTKSSRSRSRDSRRRRN